MVWNNSLDKVLSDVRSEAATDLVGLWFVQALVHQAFPTWSPQVVREATLAVVGRALEDGQIVVGEFAPGVFSIWSAQGALALARIRRAWVDVDRDLNLNDNIWLSGRDLGYRVEVTG